MSGIVVIVHYNKDMKEHDIIRHYSRRGRKYYMIDFSFRRNRVRLRGFISYEEANLVASQIRTEILMGTYDEAKWKTKRKSNISLRDFYNTVYVKTDRKLKARTEKAYDSVLRSQVLPRLGH